jgi:hypothetical protein
VALLTVAAAGCSPAIHNTELTSGLTPVPPSTPVRWQQAYSGCMHRVQPYEGAPTREQLWSLRCRGTGTHDFISVALSGGGTKAAVFSGEAMFYLEAFGLMQDVATVSSVSGGSFAAAYYALSCDHDDEYCRARPLRGLRPPPWDYQQAMRTLGTGYGALITEQIFRALTPVVPGTISASRFARFIDRQYLGTDTPERQRFRFADLNPRRPHLFLNATIITENRGGLGDESGNGCQGLRGRGYLRRRTPDEFFHFTFSDYYFGQLRSEWSSYPVSGGVAASAAFAALIDPAELTDGCDPHVPKSVIKLIDGGANDNQALVELYAVIAELAYGQRRSDLRPPAVAGAPLGAHDLQVLGPDDRAWIFVVNSSVTATTGPAGTASGPQPRGLPSLLFSVADKAFQVIDVFTAEGYALRSQLYLAEIERLHRLRPKTAVLPVEISLTELDQFKDGGKEAAQREKAGFMSAEDAAAGAPTDIGDSRVQDKRHWQAAAYQRLVHDATARRDLLLSHYHPQCYYDIRDRLDQSLVSMKEADQRCLSEAARWAVALRMQEICERASAGGMSPEGLDCSAGRAHLAHPEAVGGLPVPPGCQIDIPAPGKDQDIEASCRDLNVTLAGAAIESSANAPSAR